MTNECKYLIYGLVDPRDRLIHYIGQTRRGVRRAAEHWRKDVLDDHPKWLWLQDLKREGLDFELVVLETVSEPLTASSLCWWTQAYNPTAMNDTEVWWIAYGRACAWPLTNSTAGGGRTPRILPVRATTRELMSKSQRARCATPEGRELLERMCVASNTPEARAKRSAYTVTDETRQKQSSSARQQRATPEGQQHMVCITEAARTPEARQRHSEGRKAALAADPSKHGMLGKRHSDETRAVLSDRARIRVRARSFGEQLAGLPPGSLDPAQSLETRAKRVASRLATLERKRAK